MNNNGTYSLLVEPRSLSVGWTAFPASTGAKARAPVTVRIDRFATSLADTRLGDLGLIGIGSARKAFAAAGAMKRAAPPYACR